MKPKQPDFEVEGYRMIAKRQKLDGGQECIIEQEHEVNSNS